MTLIKRPFGDRPKRSALLKILRVRCWHAMKCDCLKQTLIVTEQNPKISLTNARRISQHRVENRFKLAR